MFYCSATESDWLISAILQKFYLMQVFLVKTDAHIIRYYSLRNAIEFHLNSLQSFNILLSFLFLLLLFV